MQIALEANFNLNIDYNCMPMYNYAELYVVASCIVVTNPSQCYFQFMDQFTTCVFNIQHLHSYFLSYIIWLAIIAKYVTMYKNSFTVQQLPYGRFT